MVYGFPPLYFIFKTFLKTCLTTYLKSFYTIVVQRNKGDSQTMKAKLTIKMLNKKNKVVLTKTEIFINMNIAIKVLKDLDENLSKNYFHFIYTLEETDAE